jgi:hypothetical protein
MTAGSKLIAATSLLHCDKVTWFCHIEASPVRLIAQALIVAGDSGFKPSNELLMK